MAKDLVSKLQGLEENVFLKQKTTMRVGGKARYFITVKSVDELEKAVKAARIEQMSHMILGGGSNVIFSDQGYPGLVIANRADKIEVEDGQVQVDSGVFLASLVRNIAEQGIGGLEFLAGIPGTVGGAVVNNAGAYGRWFKDVLVVVSVLDTKGKKRLLYPDQLGFKYRSSNLKSRTEGELFPVILRVILKTKKSTPDVVLRQINDYRKIREKTQPAGFSAGCIFCNPRVDENLPEEWKDKVKDGRISAGLLLDLAGAKKQRIGHARVSQEHGNFIVNKGRAKAQEIKTLADRMKKLVKEKSNIILNREVEFIGKFE